MMIELSKMYDLTKDEFLLLEEIVSIGNSEYIDKVERDLKNKPKS